MKTVLFDIDGTLVKSFKRNGENFWENLFRDVYGFKKDLGIDKVVSHGKTLKQLAFESLIGGGYIEEEIENKWIVFKETLIKRYLSLLEDAVPFEDAKEILDYLSGKGFELGLITGNLEEIAMAKLKLAGLDNYFSFGGFGDHLSRIEVAREAIKNLNGEFFLVGDTPLDIQAGKAVGAKTIGVATGIFSKEDLDEAGADFVVENLEQIKEVLR
jgi:phosphoglycolate phosphatase-like HAD superfamily hydrolase